MIGFSDGLQAGATSANGVICPTGYDTSSTVRYSNAVVIETELVQGITDLVAGGEFTLTWRVSDWWGLTVQELVPLLGRVKEARSRSMPVRWPSYSDADTSTTSAIPAVTKAWKANVLRQISDLADLEAGWDSYGAAGISAGAIEAAKRLLSGVIQRSSARSQYAAPYAVAPIADGGVYLEWRTKTGEIQVWIGPEGEFGYLRINQTASGPTYSERHLVPMDEVVRLVTSCPGPQACG
jgi:hypothetical protein